MEIFHQSKYSDICSRLFTISVVQVTTVFGQQLAKIISQFALWLYIWDPDTPMPQAQEKD